VVRPQDTIRRIASRYGVPEEKIIRVNNLAGDEDLKEGQKIIISLI
jgi:LysM repeat protein